MTTGPMIFHVLLFYSERTGACCLRSYAVHESDQPTDNSLERPDIFLGRGGVQFPTRGQSDMNLLSIRCRGIVIWWYLIRIYY